eukprot:1512000-Pyramimonas_sp.AAC.1
MRTGGPHVHQDRAASGAKEQEVGARNVAAMFLPGYSRAQPRQWICGARRRWGCLRVAGAAESKCVVRRGS